MSWVPPRPDHPLPPPPGPPVFHAPAPPRPTHRGAGIALAVLILIAIVSAALVPSIPQLSRRATEPTDGSYSFIMANGPGDGPVRWNPCEPIHYVVNVGMAPPGSLNDVQEAVQRTSAATGIAFAYDGLTNEIPVDERSPYQPQRYGDRWAPVLIAWVSPSQTDIPFEKDGHTAAGVASPQLPDNSRVAEYVSGWIAINAADPNPPGFASYGDQGLVVQHELGHVVGLGHVKQWGELMEGSGGGATDWGPGDLEGLKLVGRSAGCLTTPPAG